MNTAQQKIKFAIQELDNRGDREIYINSFRLIYAVSLAAHCDPDRIFPGHLDISEAHQIRFIAEDAGGLDHINSAMLDADVKYLPIYFYTPNATRLNVVDQTFANLAIIERYLQNLLMREPDFVFGDEIFLREIDWQMRSLRALGDRSPNFWPLCGLSLTALLPAFRRAVRVMEPIVRDIYPVLSRGRDPELIKID